MGLVTRIVRHNVITISVTLALLLAVLAFGRAQESIDRTSRETRARIATNCAALQKVRNAAHDLTHLRFNPVPLPADAPDWYRNYLAASTSNAHLVLSSADNALNKIHC